MLRVSPAQALRAALAVLACAFLTAEPASAAAPIRSVYYSYDLMGRQLSAKFDSASGADGVVNVYNGFGELTSSTLSMGTFSKALTFGYDGSGRRTLLTHPDSQAFTYAYDAIDRLTGVYEGNGTTTPLDTFTWNNNGTLASRSEGAGTSAVGYSWDGIGRLTGQSDTFATSTDNVSWAFTINPASQIGSEARTESSNRYAYQGVANVSYGYVVNGLNQYTSSTGTSGTTNFTYDGNANLTGDGTNAYTYDIENRLVTAVNGSTTVNLIYDPLGRLFQVDKGTSATTTRFVYDGDALVAEYDGSGTLTNRYVHGSNAAADDPLLWYAGSGLTAKKWLHADHLGSIVAVAGSTGTASINGYDEYGVPSRDSSGVNTNSGRFQYTGQAWIGELGLYYYKARLYSPSLGRFLQTDPIGYDDQINLYAYVGDDPINLTDSSGEIIDTVLDVGFLIYDGYKIATEGATAENLGALAADAVATAVPGVTGAGLATRAAAHAEGAVAKAERVAARVERTASGKRVGDFTRAQKEAAKSENAARNGGRLACTDCKRELQSSRSEKGVSTPRNQAQVHHDPPISQGGGRDSKAVVLCPNCHIERHADEARPGL